MHVPDALARGVAPAAVCVCHHHADHHRGGASRASPGSRLRTPIPPPRAEARASVIAARSTTCAANKRGRAMTLCWAPSPALCTMRSQAHSVCTMPIPTPRSPSVCAAPRRSGTVVIPLGEGACAMIHKSLRYRCEGSPSPLCQSLTVPVCDCSTYAWEPPDDTPCMCAQTHGRWETDRGPVDRIPSRALPCLGGRQC